MLVRRLWAALWTKVYLLQLRNAGVLQVRATRVKIEHGVLRIYYFRTLSAAYQHNEWSTIVREGCPANDWYAQQKPPPDKPRRTRGTPPPTPEDSDDEGSG